MSTPFRARAVFLALAGMTACVDVPEPDLTVAGDLGRGRGFGRRGPHRRADR